MDMNTNVPRKSLIQNLIKGPAIDPVLGALRTSLLFDYVGDLIQPIVLLQKCSQYSIRIQLNTDQATAIGTSSDRIAFVSGPNAYRYDTKVVFRCCKIEKNGLIMDHYPPKFELRVNGHSFSKERHSFEGSLEITNFIKISPIVTNVIDVNYARYTSGSFLLIVILVNGKKCENILETVINKRTRSKEMTKDKIIRMLKEDESDLSVTSRELSLLCPVSRQRIDVPGQGEHCTHLECFDALVYLGLNIHSNKWLCPICKKVTLPHQLVIDGYLKGVLEALRNMSLSCTTVSLLKNGSWAPIRETTEDDEILKKFNIEIKEDAPIEDEVILL